MIKFLIHLMVLGTVAFASNPEPSNNFKFGDGTLSNKNLVFNRGTSNPIIRWNESGQQLEFSNDGTNFSGIGSGSGSGAGGINLLTTNPGFENGVALGWSSSGSQAFLPVTAGTNLLFGKGSATFQTFGTGTMKSAQYTIPNLLVGQPCMAAISYKGGDGNLSLQAIDGSNTVLASTPINASPSVTVLSVPFICPNSGTVALQITSTVSAALVALDQMYLGQQTNLSQVSQAQYIGSIQFTNCSGQWSTSSTSYANFSATTGCTFATTGAVLPPSTDVPGFTLSGGPGDYMIVGTGLFEANVTAGQLAAFRMSDGTHSDVGCNVEPSSTGSGGPGTCVQHITETSGFSNLTFQLQALITVGTNANFYGTNTSVNGGETGGFLVYYFPSKAQTAFNPATAAWFVDVTNSSYLIGNSFGPAYSNNTGQTQTLNTGSIAASIPCSGTNPPQAGTCSSGTPEDGVSLVVPVPGVIEVCNYTNPQIEGTTNSQSFIHIDQTANADDSSIIFTGETTLHETFVPGTFLAESTTLVVCEKVNVKAAGQVTFRLNQQTISLTHWAPQYSRWTVRPMNQQVPAPVLMNQIVTPSSGVEIIARANFGGPGSMASPTNCTVDPCTIYSQSGNWVTAANRVGTGVYHLTISPIFSDFPTCHSTVLTGLGSPATECVATSLTTIACIISTGGTGFDGAQGVICMGPH